MHDFINSANDIIWGYLLIYLLLGAGIYFTIRSRFVQFRHISHVFTVMRRSLKTERGGISSFGAFATGLAARVGTGNIAGVAIALTLGGPGAIFWMWIVSIVGMATSFVENTLAQIYKVKGERGTFRGGPAFYMERGLGLRWMASLFSILLVLTFGFVFIAVQSNSMTVARRRHRGPRRGGELRRNPADRALRRGGRATDGHRLPGGVGRRRGHEHHRAS